MANDAEMDVQVVYETTDYGQGCWERKVGLRIGNQVRWWGMDGYGHDSAEFAKIEAALRHIVDSVRGSGAARG